MANPGTLLALGAVLMAWLLAGYLCFREDFHVKLDAVAARALALAVLALLVAAWLLTHPDEPGYGWLVSLRGPFAFEFSRFRLSLAVFGWIWASRKLLTSGTPSLLALPSLAAAAALTALLSTSGWWQLIWFDVSFFVITWRHPALTARWRSLFVVTLLAPLMLALVGEGTLSFELEVAALGPVVGGMFLAMVWCFVAVRMLWLVQEHAAPAIMGLTGLEAFALAWNLIVRVPAGVEFSWVWLAAGGLLAVGLTCLGRGRTEAIGLSFLVLAATVLATGGASGVLAGFYFLLLSCTLIVCASGSGHTQIGALLLPGWLVLGAPLVSFAWWARGALAGMAFSGTLQASPAQAALAVDALVMLCTGWWLGQAAGAEQGKPEPWALAGVALAGLLAALPYATLWLCAPGAAVFLQNLPPSLSSLAGQVHLAANAATYWGLVAVGLGLLGYLGGAWWPYSLLDKETVDAHCC